MGAVGDARGGRAETLTIPYCLGRPKYNDWSTLNAGHCGNSPGTTRTFMGGSDMTNVIVPLLFDDHRGCTLSKFIELVRHADPVFDRVMAKVLFAEHGQWLCWDFGGATDGKGYGFVRVGSRTDKSVHLERVHRVTYEALVGPIASGLELDHLCRNRACCHPCHLEPVTHGENMRRAALARTHCKNGHDWTRENITITGQGFQTCVICLAATNRRAKDKRKQLRQESKAIR